MPDSDAWEAILGGDASGTALVVDCSAGMRRELDFAELEARIRSGYRYLRTKLLAGGRGERLSGDAYVSRWSEDIRRAGNPVVAVFGSRVGSVYAAAIADSISRWQQRPAVILFDPQAAGIELLNEEFRRELTSLSSLFSADEIERARKIGHKVTGPATRDVAAVAAEIFEDYLEMITAAYERVGLGDPRDSELTEPFRSYISLISAASQIDQDCVWERSTAITSADYPDVLYGEFLNGPRRIKFDVRHADLFRSDSVTAMISDLLQPSIDGVFRRSAPLSVTARREICQCRRPLVCLLPVQVTCVIPC